jgi:hypothetical protein
MLSPAWAKSICSVSILKGQRDLCSGLNGDSMSALGNADNVSGRIVGTTICSEKATHSRRAECIQGS